MADIKIAGRIKAGAADNIAGYASEILFDDAASNKTVKEKLEGKQDTLTFDNVPTADSDNPVKSGGVYQAIQDIDVPGQISGKADKSEMSVVAGTGANADKTTITLKNGTSATVLTQHQDISGKANSADVYTKTRVDDMIEDVAHWGDTVGNVTTADFNAQTDTVWNKTQVLGSTQQATARSNINAQETLVSGTNIKTINNISILGSGNINISGGGSSTVQEVNHGTSDTTFTLTPNVFHVWGTVSSLTLTLGTGESGVMNEYMFQFDSGSTATTLSLPSSVKWITDSTISANKTYQVSILNNLAVMGGA